MLAKSANETQPERWRTAYKRDRLSGADYADAAPGARRRHFCGQPRSLSL
jgi:hypothetical protein